jgi:hypothetical protein
MSATFLNHEELTELTGRSFKSLQIKQLRKMGIAFNVNATGHPVVARSTIEARVAPPVMLKAAWVPRVLKAG